jgi:pyruvate formate lyase activating enzyme
MDSKAHQRWTGQNNDCILKNLSLLDSSTTSFIVRVPLISGVTDTDENMQSMVAHLKTLSRRPQVELMPYNRAAGGKYAACGFDWHPGFDEARPVNDQLETFLDNGIDASLI